MMALNNRRSQPGTPGLFCAAGQTEERMMDADTRQQLASRIASLPAQWVAGFPLTLDETGVSGRFFKCELRSCYRTLDLGGASLIRGELAAQGPDGAPYPADKLFQLAAGADGLLKLDRLCRLIHALNHFIVAGQQQPLLLAINSRLFDYVKVAHGRTFARMLQHFELSQHRIVLEVPAGLPQAVLDGYLGEGFVVRLAG